MPRDRIWALVWLGGAITCLVLLAAGISGLTFAPGHLYDLSALRALFGGSAQARAVDPASVAFWQTLMAAISLGLLAALAVALIVSAELRRELLRRLLLALAAIALIYLILALLRSLPGGEGPAPVPALPTAPPAAAEPFPAFDPQPAPWLVLAIGLLIAAVLAGALWLAWRRTRAERPASAQLADEAQAAIHELEAGGDLRDAVLRCYRDMSRVLGERQGVARAQSATPREFEAQLAAAGLRDEHIRRLTRLFERVRYGARRADADEEREALACLTAIVQAYGRAP